MLAHCRLLINSTGLFTTSSCQCNNHDNITSLYQLAEAAVCNLHGAKLYRAVLFTAKQRSELQGRHLTSKTVQIYIDAFTTILLEDKYKFAILWHDTTSYYIMNISHRCKISTCMDWHTVPLILFEKKSNFFFSCFPEFSVHTIVSIFHATTVMPTQ